jgi:multiple sugar transport system substrate-binding protein
MMELKCNSNKKGEKVRMNAIKMKAISVILLAGSVGLSGCGGGGGSNGAEGVKTGDTAASIKPKEPITLNFYAAQNVFINFDKDIAEPIKIKYPHITLRLIKNEKGASYQELIAAGQTFDIIYESAAFTNEKIVENGLEYDLEEMVKKYKLNLQQFEPNVLEQSTNSTIGKKLYGIPFLVNKYVLTYNKDIFDRFGATYPRDGMMWDEVFELAKKVSRTDNGINYQGFNPSLGLIMLNNQLSLSPFDPKADRAILYTEDWIKLVANLTRFYTIANNNQILPVNDFAKGQIAMTVHNTNPIASWVSANPNLNWDMASAPMMKERPGIGFKPATLALFVGKSSKYKDEAFQVIQELVSEAVQLNITKTGFASPLASTAVKSAFGQESPVMKGKNTKAVYYLKDASASEPRASNLTSVDVSFAPVFNKVILEGVDVNTALRQYEEEINKAIQTAKEKAK